MSRAVEEVLTLAAFLTVASLAASAVITYFSVPKTLKSDLCMCMEREGVCKLVFRTQADVSCVGNCLRVCTGVGCYTVCVDKDVVCRVEGAVDCIILYSNSTHVVICGCRER